MKSSPPHLDEEAAWAAVLARDPAAEDRFVYAVTSTGIYCRPTCPARRPRRDRIAFFLSPGAAETAGFRACRRCRPASGRPSAARQRVELVRAYLDANPDETVTLQQLARLVRMSPAHLQRTFKCQIGLSPREYADARRVERLKELLRRGDSVTDATYEAGYGAASRLYEKSNARLGMTPATYRKGGSGIRIRYTVIASSLGTLLVAATERGLCAVTLGDDGDSLVTGLHGEYPRAEIERADEGPAEWIAWVEQVVQRVAGTGELAGSPPPLDLEATSFQWRVWKALQEIPRGTTKSYGEVAAAIGRPGAARAVANACAGNRVALVVPCHRVVRGDGEAGGYRWGAERKRRLLALESET
ncbi:MAG TPA: bifunctional DNA-binding transcriptional regulator/O6-methylguanine-DNA methyltransferase Ada, partial [Thermoanaerobaculia bacterium]|nr:bifunctional DNA-binding transcriptional regulator/O6-methylguanine-DNA methyltransferase Ada [Thermoanaerobaculia bacterium]